MIKKMILRAGVILGVAGFMLVPGADASMALEKPQAIKFNLLPVKGVVFGKVVLIDAKYGKRYNVPVPAPFSLIAYSQDGAVPLFVTADKRNAGLIKVIFVSGDSNTAKEDRRFIENLMVVKMNLPMGEKDSRLKTLANLLINNGYKQAVAKFPKNKYLGVKKIKVGKYDAVEVVGKYLHPKQGLMLLRLVGIPNPDSPDSVITISSIAARYYDVKNSDELANTMSGTSLRTFKYLKP